MPRKLTGTLENSSSKKRPNPVPGNACPACGSIMEEVKGELDFPVNGEDIHVPDISHLRCPTCDEVMLRLDEARELREQAFALYQNKYGLLTASEIRRIRERLGLTQSRLATLLRLGANTISRWESGRTVQTASMDLMLRMVRDVPGVSDYIQKHISPEPEFIMPLTKRQISESEAAYAELTILALLNESGGICSIKKFRAACILLSSKDELVRLAPSGMRRIVKQWTKQMSQSIPLIVWRVAIDDLLDRKVISRDISQGELALKLQPGLDLERLSSDEWLTFEARAVLKIIDAKDPGFSEELEQSLTPQDREKIKVAS